MVKVLREEGESIPRALFDLLPLFVFFPSLFFYNLYSKVALHQYPVVTIIFYCFAFADMVIRMMVSHITKTPLDSEKRYVRHDYCLMLDLRASVLILSSALE